MFKLFTILNLIVFSTLSQAEATALYQVDLLVFTHQLASTSEATLAGNLALQTHQAIRLDTEVSSAQTPYHLLPPASSHLRQELGALKRKAQYQVLFHYSWLQPFNSQRPIRLPIINSQGWQVEGTVGIRRANYYLLDANLVFSTPNSSEEGFAFSQKQRLKGGMIYYLDHPKAGLLIKVSALK